MWKLLKTKTFWVGIGTAFTGVGAGIGLLCMDPPQIVEGWAAIWAAFALGAKAITQRHSDVKIEEKLNRVLDKD